MPNLHRIPRLRQNNNTRISSCNQRIPTRQFDPFIRAIGFFSRQEEAQGIASLVKSLVVDERIPPERICITTLRLDSYAELFREQLATHGIPANITAR